MMLFLVDDLSLTSMPEFFLFLQVMRTNRPFVVSLLDATGEEVCQVDIFCAKLYPEIVVE